MLSCICSEKALLLRGAVDVEDRELTFVRLVWRAVEGGQGAGAVSAAAVDLLRRMARV